MPFQDIVGVVGACAAMIGGLACLGRRDVYAGVAWTVAVCCLGLALVGP